MRAPQGRDRHGENDGLQAGHRCHSVLMDVSLPDQLGAVERDSCAAVQAVIRKPNLTAPFEGTGGQQDAQEARPVPLLGEPWPGVPARGRGASDRADACWLPIAKGLTPHGLRHTHRTVMEDLGTEKVLMDERMGHIDGSVSARCAHVTPGMRKRLMLGLTEQWEMALGARLAMSPKRHRCAYSTIFCDARSTFHLPEESQQGGKPLAGSQPGAGSRSLQPGWLPNGAYSKLGPV